MACLLQLVALTAATAAASLSQYDTNGTFVTFGPICFLELEIS